MAKVLESKYVIFIAFIAAIAGFLFGLDTGLISGALQFIVKTFHLSEEQYLLQELIVSSVPLGALFGAILSGLSASFLGRRYSIILTAIFFVLGAVIIMSAPIVEMVIVGRLILGIAIGISAMVVPMYLAEISPIELRGGIVFLFQLAITVGLTSAFIINYIFASNGNWRMMFATTIFPALVMGITMLFLPSSPRWLLQNKRSQEAEMILKKLRGSTNIEHELCDIKESLTHFHGQLSDLFKKPLIYLVGVTFGLFVFQQLSGINTIFYYAPTIFTAVGYNPKQGAIIAAISTGAMNVFATLIGVWCIERIGRRKLLLVGFLGTCFCLFLLSLSYHNVFGMNHQVLTLALVLAFVFFFAVSLGGVPYLLMAELFPINVRHHGMAIASCANWTFNIFVSFTFLSFIHFVGIGNTFLIYSIASCVGFFFAYFIIPETKGCSLETIELNLYRGRQIRYLGRTEEGSALLPSSRVSHPFVIASSVATKQSRN